MLDLTNFLVNLYWDSKYSDPDSELSSRCSYRTVAFFCRCRTWRSWTRGNVSLTLLLEDRCCQASFQTSSASGPSPTMDRSAGISLQKVVISWDFPSESCNHYQSVQCVCVCSWVCAHVCVYVHVRVGASFSFTWLCLNPF